MGGAANLASAAELGQGIFEVSAADLSKVTFVGGATVGPETVTVSVEGSAGGWGTATPVAVAVKAPPPVTLSGETPSLVAGQTVAVARLFTVDNPANTPITEYEIIVSSGTGGVINLNGATNLLGSDAASGCYVISATDLAKVTYEASADGSQEVAFAACSAQGWSQWAVSTTSITEPLAAVTGKAVSLIEGQAVAVSGLFTASESTGGAISDFWFETSNGGSIFLNGATNLASAAQAAVGIVGVSASELTKLTYVAGPSGGMEALDVWALNANGWSTPTVAAVTVTAPPTVIATGGIVATAQSVAVSSLFSTSDANGNFITTYRFQAAGGVINLHGASNLANATLTAQGIVEVSAADVSKVTFVGGNAGGTETVTIWAKDTTGWSSGALAYTTAVVPIVTAVAGTVVENQSIAVSGLFCAVDANHNTITDYKFQAASGGAINLCGAANLASAAEIAQDIVEVSAADLSKIKFVGGPTVGTETLKVWALDSTGWSAAATANVDVTLPATLTGKTLPVAMGQEVAVTTLFSAVTPVNDTIFYYDLNCNPASGGTIKLNGATNLWGDGATKGGGFAIMSSEISKVTFLSGSVAGPETVSISCQDNFGVGAAVTATVNITLPTTVISSSASLVEGHSVAASRLFTTVDPNATSTVADYKFVAGGGGTINLGGAVNLASAAEAAQGIVEVSVADLSKVTFVGGSTPGIETFTSSVNTGIGWSNSATATVTIVVPSPPVVTCGAVTVWAGRPASVSSLFTASNPDGDAITGYQFQAARGGTINLGGATNLASVADAAQGIVEVSAADLSKLTFVGGNAAETEALMVKARDAAGWSAVATTTVTTLAPPQPPTVTANTVTISAGQAVAISNFFTASDPGGGALLYYTFAYNPANGGAVSLNGAVNQWGSAATAVGEICVSAADLSKVTFVASNTAVPQTLTIGTQDATGTSIAATATINVNLAPFVTKQTTAQTWEQRSTVRFALPSDTFADPTGKALSYAATQADGRALPSWLSFNPETKTFSGVVPAGAETLSVKVTVTDTAGLSAFENFVVTVPAVAPVARQVIAAQTWNQGSPINFAVPAGTFTDPNGQTLTYTAMQSDGQALPSWLSFNTKTDTFTGVVPSGMEELTLKVTATDTSGLSVSETFGVTVPGAPPTVIGTSVTATAGQSFSVSSLFSTVDPNNAPMLYYYLSYNPASGAKIDLGGATNYWGAAASANGGFAIGAGDISKLTFIAGSKAGTETLSISAQDWYSATGSAGVVTVSVVAPQTVPAAALPVVTGRGASLVAGQSVKMSSLFSAADASGKSITEYRFQATGGGVINLGGAINLASTDQRAQGVVMVSAGDLSKLTFVGGSSAGPETLSVQAKDASGWSVASTSTLSTTLTSVTTQSAPTPPAVVANAVSVSAGQSIAVSSLFTFDEFAGARSLYYYLSFDPASGAMVDLGGATNYWGDAATSKGGIAISAADISKLTLITGTKAGPEIFSIRGQDDYGLSNTAAATITVVTPPALTNQTAAQTWAQGSTVNLALPTGTFTDPNGQALTYAATLSNGQPLPSWLSFNTQTRTFSGVVPADMETLTLKVTVTDTAGLSASENIAVTIPGAPPRVTRIIAPQTWTQGSTVSFGLPSDSFIDPNGQALTYAATLSNGQALPSWLSFNAQTRTFSGVVPAGMDALVLKVTASDALGCASSETFAVTVPAAAPVLTNPTANLMWMNGSAVNFTLPGGTFTDPNGQALTYRATLANGQPLPSWLSFNGQTGTFTGIAPAGMASFTVQVIATDTSNLSAVDTFTVTVPLEAPTLANQTAAQTWIQGNVVNFTVPSGTFSDPNGQTLTYAASQSNGQALPSWLSFNTKTATFSGMVPAGLQVFTLKVTATDTSGLATFETFTVTDLLMPVASKAIAAQTWTQGSAVSFAVPTGTFTDPNGQTLSYTAMQSSGQALPSWLSFNTKTGVFSGTVPAGMEALTLKVIATDASGLAVSRNFTVTVPGAPPVVTGGGQVLGQGQSVALSSLFSAADPDGNPITQYKIVDPAGQGVVQLNGARNLASTGDAARGIYWVAASDLSKVTYVGGSGKGSENLSILAYDGTDWSNATGVTITLANRTAVVVTASPTLGQGQSVALSSLFSASDADADTITQYKISDPAGQGTVHLNGARNLASVSDSANGVYIIAASDLSKLTYCAGSDKGSERLAISAYDGKGWGVAANATITLANRAAVVTTVSPTLAQGQSVAVSSLFSASDPDGDAIAQYKIVDRAGQGTVQLNGARNLASAADAANGVYVVAATDLSRLTYVAGSDKGSEALAISAYDGINWGAAVNATVTLANRAAVVTTSSPTLAQGRSVALSSLFSASDADGDAITLYRIADPAGQGTVRLNGARNLASVSDAANGIYVVAATDLSKITYSAGSDKGRESLAISAYDGKCWGLSVLSTITLADRTPVVTMGNFAVGRTGAQVVASIASATDPDSDAISRWRIVDPTGLGSIQLNGAVNLSKAANMIEVSAADFGKLSYVGASSKAGTETLTISAYDGQLWSGTVSVQALNDTAPVVVATKSGQLTIGRSVALSGLLSATDADGDRITTWEFTDPSGLGSLSLGGASNLASVAQKAAGVTVVSAADLTKVGYSAGQQAGSETLTVRAYDSLRWSDSVGLEFVVTAAASSSGSSNTTKSLLAQSNSH